MSVKRLTNCARVESFFRNFRPVLTRLNSVVSINIVDLLIRSYVNSDSSRFSERRPYKRSSSTCEMHALLYQEIGPKFLKKN